MNTKILGNQGEDLAVVYLRQNGYRIHAQKYRSPIGEIDIIAEKDNVLAFIEVKTRRSERYGAPAQAVNLHKQRKIILTAYYYVGQKNLENKLCRFDVIEVYCPLHAALSIQHYTNAFEVQS